MLKIESFSLFTKLPHRWEQCADYSINDNGFIRVIT